ncbi:MAG TPA: hypothetical protein PLV92_25945, partial [Pirellulaceae bacterium]|nr:hypothetical protein [Pirellulaceae bacterium]
MSFSPEFFSKSAIELAALVPAALDPAALEPVTPSRSTRFSDFELQWMRWFVLTDYQTQGAESMVISVASSRSSDSPSANQSGAHDVASQLTRRRWLVAALATGGPVMVFGTLRSAAAQPQTQPPADSKPVDAKPVDSRAIEQSIE